MKLSHFFKKQKISRTKIPDITAFGCEQYQDIIVNKKIIQKASSGHSALDERYSIIHSFLCKYKRPFTLLDIGASQGYYSLRVAADFPCVSVMLEGNNSHYPMIGSQLQKICEANDELDNIILLKTPIIPGDIQRMSECESVDVVLALNILHWFQSDWMLLADSILELGDNVIIETPPVENSCKALDAKTRADINNYLLKKGAELIGLVKRHTSDVMSPVYHVSRPKKTLKRKTWLMPELSENRLEISSSFLDKKLTKNTEQESKEIKSNWIPGINLITYLMCNGRHPSRKHIASELIRLSEHKTHNDWTANNMIVQGNKLELIDWPSSDQLKEKGRTPTRKVVSRHKRFLKMSKQADVENFFWKKLL